MAETPIAGAADSYFLTNRIRFDADDPPPGDPPSDDPPGDPPGDDPPGDPPPDDPPSGDPPEAYWPDDWRESYVDNLGLEGEDRDKELKVLGRYTSPSEMIKAGRSAQTKISSGQYKQPLGEDATEAEIQQYREEAGIPEKPEDYKVELSDGRVFGEDQQPIVDEFLKYAHATNMPPEEVNGTLNWYSEIQETAAAQQHEADVQFKDDSVDTLRQEWGSDYRINVNAGEVWLSGLPNGLGEMLAGGRMADGTPIGAHPEFLKLASQIGREQNPYTRVVKGEGDLQAEAVENQIKELEDRMANDPNWHKDTAAHQTYQKLITARDDAAKLNK
jgi:hypothetical protein